MKVAILANSVASAVEPPPTNRAEGNYALHLRSMLGDVEVRSAARWYQLVTHALDYYEPYVRAWSPDVLIVQYGVNEAVPKAFPMALHKHLFTWKEHTPWRRYKWALRRRVWPPLRRYQQVFSRVVGQRSYRVPLRRYADELQYLVELARKETACLVLVLDVLPPGPTVEHWIPGMHARRDAINTTMRDVVRTVDDRAVRFIDTSAGVAALGGHGLPDGIHLSNAGHRIVAELLVREITAWRG
jgi:lysophospholipase L1-like esterase